jgi:ADP-ribosylglycohydrolase
MTAGPTLRSRFRGCLLGGAVGDALGAGIEFLSLDEIRDEFGPAGVTGYVPAYGRRGALTDDTQMTLFTAEGLIRAQQSALAGRASAPPVGRASAPPAGRASAPSADRASDAPAKAGGPPDEPSVIWGAYQRWLTTQDGGSPEPGPGPSSGWLIGQPFLHAVRAPGMTCLEALRSGRPGSTTAPANDSKGCGGVMRVAPVGLAADDPFTLGCQAAALTHGHPSGYLAAGALALMIREITAGRDLHEAVATAVGRLRDLSGSAEVITALNAAVAAARATAGSATPEAIASLGQGWVAEEALGIATYCALAGCGFRPAVLLAVNHDGDSDSTGAICGNLLGAALGEEAIDADLLGELEGREVIGQVAEDLYRAFAERRPIPGGRYPAD